MAKKNTPIEAKHENTIFVRSMDDAPVYASVCGACYSGARIAES